jgi:hypothetical protein
MPGKVRELGRKVDCVLASATTDLEQVLAVAEARLQRREDRRTVLDAGFGEGLVHCHGIDAHITTIRRRSTS